MSYLMRFIPYNFIKDHVHFYLQMTTAGMQERKILNWSYKVRTKMNFDKFSEIYVIRKEVYPHGLIWYTLKLYGFSDNSVTPLNKSN